MHFRLNNIILTSTKSSNSKQCHIMKPLGDMQIASRTKQAKINVRAETIMQLVKDNSNSRATATTTA